MSAGLVLAERDEVGVLTVTLNRPAVFNAINKPMLLELLEIFKGEAAAPATRCVILTGAGKAFCSGQDLEERRPFAEGQVEPPSIGESLRERYNPLILLMRELPKPVIGAINGVAAGAGCSLALACDLRIMADNASLMESFVRVGLGLDCGSSFFLPRLAGLARAYEIALLGDRIDAASAERLGLVNRVVSAERLSEETSALARRLAAGPPAALARIKRQLNYALNSDLAGALEYEAVEQAGAVQSTEYREGLRAFFEKRPPQF